MTQPNLYKATVLGLKLEDKLSWNKHIHKVAKKVNTGIGVNRKIRARLVNRDALISVYALINPHFDYCSEVRDSMGVGVSNRLQKLQDTAARVMNFSNDISGTRMGKFGLGKPSLKLKQCTRS